MLFILIPLFLGVNIPTNDSNIETWINGPEFTFTGRIDYKLFSDVTLENPDHAAVVKSTLKCRLKAMDKLLCDSYNVTLEETDRENSVFPDTKFIVRFNESGIESLMFEELQTLSNLNVLRSFVSLLSVNAGSIFNKDIPSEFVTMEQTIFGPCSTYVTVKRFNKSEEDFSSEELKTESKYPFEFLKFPKTDFGPDILIVKKTNNKRCFNTEYGHYPDSHIVKATTKLYISDTFDGEMQYYVKERNSAKHDNIIQIKIRLGLVDIEPCKEKMPKIKFFEETSLMLTDSINDIF